MLFFNNRNFSNIHWISGCKTTGKVDEPAESIDNKIRKLLEKKPLTLKEILNRMKMVWTEQKLTHYLKKLNFTEVVKRGGINLFRLKGIPENKELKLF